MTARWVVDVVKPERDLNVTWQPISLLFKNEPPEDSEYYGPVMYTHKLLRVFEAINAKDGNEAAGNFYWTAGTMIHHDEKLYAPVEEILEAAGMDASFASAFEDESWDSVIREKMDVGLGLVGQDVGTPIIAFEKDDGEQVGIFGPVISRAPTGDEGLALWDAMVTMSTMDGFWELKRTRTEGPNFGDRPTID